MAKPYKIILMVSVVLMTFASRNDSGHYRRLLHATLLQNTKEMATGAAYVTVTFLFLSCIYFLSDKLGAAPGKKAGK